MYQIRISSIENPNIYRIVQVPEDMTLFNFESIVSIAFSIENEGDVYFETIRVNGKQKSKMISVFDKNFNPFDSSEETIEDWLKKIYDEMRFKTESGIHLKLILEQIIDIEDLEPCIIDGEGDLFSKRKKVNIDVLNTALKIGLKFEQDLLSGEVNDLFNLMDPDYSTLLILASELKKMKPWKYFENGEIVAVELNGIKYFISVMGAGGQEYGLMMYDEVFGYQSLEKILNREPLPEDYAMGLSALTVNFVDRNELNKKDYDLIKEHGFSFRGKKEWIAFRTYEPSFVPRQPNYLEVETMIDLIQIMIEITEMRKNGWKYPMIPINSFPLFKQNLDGDVEMLGIITMERVEDWTVEIELYDIEVARVKKKKKSSLEIEFDCFYLQKSFKDENEKLRYPLIYLIADHSTGIILQHETFSLPKNSYVQQMLFWKVIDSLDVRPSKVFVNKETYRYLKPVAKLVGIELAESKLSKLEKFKKMY